MTYLSEDPTLLAGGLLLVACGFVVALRVTQQGKYLVRALIAAALAAVVVVVEWAWVTDNERIEQVVYGLRQAVANSDVEGVLNHLTPDVLYSRGDTAMEGDATREFIRANLGHARFEIVQISGLETDVGEQSRRGTATFRVFAKGTMDSSMPFGTASSAWSLGLQETGPGVWKVNRITPMQIPSEALPVPNGLRNSRPSATRPDDDGSRARRKGNRGGGHPVDPRFFNRENADAPGAQQ
jgi:ketosteroid isomerase-like protein